MFTSTSLEVKFVRNWNFPVSFEIAEWSITHNFVYFSNLQQLAASFVTDILLTALKFEWDGFENFDLVFVTWHKSKNNWDIW